MASHDLYNGTFPLSNTSPENCNSTVYTLLNTFSSKNGVTRENITSLLYFCGKGFEAKEDEKFSKPAAWIGMYMAVASFVCILSLLAGMWNKRYRISSKYTSLNVTSMLVITIAMKLTVDLTSSMPSNLDQMAKIGSIAFMCTILAILNPSLASMNNKTLLENFIGLVILIVTIAVNLFIEILTDVIRNDDEGPKNHVSEDKDKWTFKLVSVYEYSVDYANYAYAYIGFMMALLVISIFTAMHIKSVKEILESKYQVKRKTIINDQQQHTSSRIPKVKELTQHVTKYWIMAKTGSPEFVTACNLSSYTSLLLCATGMGMHIYILATLNETNAYDGNLESDYRWSISVIIWTQFLGNVVGVVLVTFRCIRCLKFINVTWEFTDLFKLRDEKYWAPRLSEWMARHIGYQSSYPRSITSHILHFMKKCGLSLLVGLQKILIFVNRSLALICIGSLYLIIKVYDVLRSNTPVVSRKDDIKLGDYVLQPHDGTPSQEVLENIKKSMNHMIERSASKKKQNDNLLELLVKKSDGFKGVEILDDDVDPLPLSVKLNSSWSVPVITLTCIAISVPGIEDQVNRRLIGSIDEALFYTRHVEKSFNSAREYANIRKTAVTLWYEVKQRKWLGNPINGGKCGKQPEEILNWFADKAKPFLREKETNLKKITGVHKIEFPYKFIAADSIQRVSNSIRSKYGDEIQTNERFYELLCSMIADILVACFSNIPQVIMMKCHADEIEKREASVEAAVELLGRSTKIIEKLEECELPNPEKRASIDEWLIHLKQSSIP